MRRLFIFLLVAFVLLDVGLFIYFLNKSSTSKTPPVTTQQTDTVGPPRVYSLGLGETRLIRGDPKTGSLDQTLFTATVEKEVFYDQKTNEALISAVFTTKNGKEVKADVILGKEGGKVVSTTAKEGENVDNVAWGPPSEISAITPLLKKGGSIFVRIYSQSISQDFYNNPPFECDAKCKEWLDDINKYYKNNLSLIKMVKGEIDGKNGLKVGPTSGIIIYATN